MISGPILIVEDEKNIGITLSEYLRSIGYDCFLATKGLEARKIFHEKAPNVIFMDIGLPDTCGLQLAREFKKERKNFVLLFLSAQNDPDIKVEGLEIGAEDYITKPFALKEITIRLQRVLKMQESMINENSQVQIGKMTIHFDRFEIESGNGDTLPLSQKENGILKLLYKNKNRAVTREKMIEHIWGANNFPSNRTVDNYIVKIRKLFDKESEPIAQIVSIRGIGYKLSLNNEY